MPDAHETTAPTLAETQETFRTFAGKLSPTILLPHPDDAIRAVAGIALLAKKQQAGWGKLRLEALRVLGRFLIRRGKGQGRPAKTSAGDVLPILARLGITDRHISADAKNVARVSNTDFDAYLRQEDEPTLKGLLRFACEMTGEPHADWKAHRAATEAANINFEASSTQWLTPPQVFEAMDTEFDLDVASPGARAVPWIPAKEHYTKKQNGLRREWRGFVWLNGPFGVRNGMEDWIQRFIEHGDGVALVPDFTSTAWWQKLARNSDAILFVCPKLQFLPKVNGCTNTLGTTLAAIGKSGVLALQNAEANGLGVCFRRGVDAGLYRAPQVRGRTSVATDAVMAAFAAD